MSEEQEKVLSLLCESIDRAVKVADEERARAQLGDSPPIELLLARFEKTRVEIRQETAPHKEPHVHVVHSDKIDVSLSIRDFSVLAGKIDRRSLKHIKRALLPNQPALMKIWNELGSCPEAWCTSLGSWPVHSYSVDHRGQPSGLIVAQGL